MEILNLLLDFLFAVLALLVLLVLALDEAGLARVFSGCLEFFALLGLVLFPVFPVFTVLMVLFLLFFLLFFLVLLFAPPA